MADYYSNEYSDAGYARTPTYPQPQAPSPSNIFNPSMFGGDSNSLLRRGIKYLLEGFAVAVAAYLITKGTMRIRDIVILGITAALVFAILDSFSPTVALGTRFGAGFGIGQGLFGAGVLGAAVRPIIV